MRILNNKRGGDADNIQHINIRGDTCQKTSSVINTCMLSRSNKSGSQIICREQLGWGEKNSHSIITDQVHLKKIFLFITGNRPLLDPEYQTRKNCLYTAVWECFLVLLKFIKESISPTRDKTAMHTTACVERQIVQLSRAFYILIKQIFMVVLPRYRIYRKK